MRHPLLFILPRLSPAGNSIQSSGGGGWPFWVSNDFRGYKMIKPQSNEILALEPPYLPHFKVEARFQRHSIFGKVTSRIYHSLHRILS